MEVPPKVLKRIFELRKAGMSVRGISKQLKKEKLGSYGKTKIHEIITTLLPKLEADIEQELSKDEALQKLESEVKEHEAKERIRKRKNELYMRKAGTWEGLREIFSSPQELLKFAQQVLGENDNGELLQNWQLLVNNCQNSNPVLAETLFELVGSLEDYKEWIAEEPGSLEWYISNEIRWYIDAEKEKERLARIQKGFERGLQVKCPFCGKMIKGMIFVGNIMHCSKCGEQVSCLCSNNCEGELFLIEGHSLRCNKCNMIFKLPKSFISNSRFLKGSW